MTDVDGAAGHVLDHNEVRLRGRLTGPPQLRTLPSGDQLVTFRLTVRRPAGERGSVDSVDCVTTRARSRRSVVQAPPGAVVEVEGALRRRFWRGPAGPQSRYAVDVTTLRRVRVPAEGSGDSPGVTTGRTAGA